MSPDTDRQNGAALGAAVGALGESSDTPNPSSSRTLPPEGEAEYQVVDPSMPANEAAECTAAGGIVRLALAPAPMEYCEIPAADGGKSFSKSSDCEKYCDADTRQCSSLSGSGFWVQLGENGERQEVVQ